MGNLPTIKEFAGRHGLATDDPLLKHLYDCYVKARLELRSERGYLWEEGWEEGFVEGYIEGFHKGVNEERQRIADVLRDLGVDEDIIAQAIAPSNAWAPRATAGGLGPPPETHLR